MKRFLLICLSAFALVSVHAEIIWSLSDDGTLTISGADMPNYSFNNSPWYSQRKMIRKVDIKEGVSCIGNYAFEGCSSLTSITIPNSVTSIDNKAFEFCYSLESIYVEIGNANYDNRGNCNAIIETATNTLIKGCEKTVIPNSVTSIGEVAFRGCSALTSITIPNSVTSIGNSAFMKCM